ncbi:MAG TPA: S8 family serine peptidase, partial [Mycobacteriales bacterium]|nr:S8 family serine peptidase [Mycobacteriales bacterium]
GVAALPGLVLTTAGSAAAAPGSPAGARPVPVPDSVKAAGFDAAGSLAPALRNAKGTVTVSVALSAKPVGASVPEDALITGAMPSKASQQAQTAAVKAQQNQVIGRARELGATAVGRANRAANVVAMSVAAGKLAELAAIPGVVSVKPVGRYETRRDPGGSGSLAQAADYIEATAVRNQGYDGTGVKIAVLDSGIDYTHEYLGGPGTVAAYQACYAQRDVAPTGECAALFGPGAPKVKGGYDFVGEAWPGTATAPAAEAPDPNPIDFEGHGTHVADIAAGRSADGSHQGIAPGADLYAVKVCSAVSSSCSGVALLQGVDWVLDPNGDGDISDAMDIMNASLGSPYGQIQDDLTVAVDNAIRAGVVGVVSAGNNADRPFIVGSPSTAARAISVAQTALPDDVLYTIATSAGEVRNSKRQSWSPAPSAVITAPLAQPSPLTGCAAADFATFPAGAIALVQRGICNASLKAQNAQAAGAVAVVIWNNVPGDPPDFSFGGGAPVTIPTLTISLADGQRLSAAVAAGPVTATIDPAATTSLRNTTVGTSSRGPAISGIRPKPDIGAPGAWLSAEVGTGTGQTNFGGTSGAAPVVTGAAALILDKLAIPPALVKSRLLNGASKANRTPDAQAALYPTPISRIGAGEVRVAPAANARGVLLNRQVGNGNIGFGLPHLTRTTTYTRELRLRGAPGTTYRITPEFRDPADAASGAVTVRAPASVTVPAGRVARVTVKVTIDPAKLARWPFTHAAGYTGSGADLNAPEFDGWLNATSGSEQLHLGWTVLPHRSADVTADRGRVRLTDGAGRLSLSNASRVLDGRVNVFGLTGTSPRQAEPAPGEPGSPGSNLALIDLAAAGVRDDVPTGVIQFAVAGQQRQTVPLYPAGYEIDVDTDRDGDVDYAVFQQEAVGAGSSGLSLVYVLNVATNAAAAYYYTDADFDSSTQVLSAPLSALGLTNGSTFDFAVLAYDNYFTGAVTDVIEGQTWTVGSQKYGLDGGADQLVVPAGGSTSVTVRQDTTAGPSSQTGLLLLYDDAARRDAQAVRVTGGTTAP